MYRRLLKHKEAGSRQKWALFSALAQPPDERIKTDYLRVNYF